MPRQGNVFRIHASIRCAFPVAPPDVFSLQDAGSGLDEHGPAPGAWGEASTAAEMMWLV